MSEYPVDPCEIRDGFIYLESRCTCDNRETLRLGLEYYHNYDPVLFACLDCVDMPKSDRAMIEGKAYMDEQIGNMTSAALAEVRTMAYQACLKLDCPLPEGSEWWEDVL